MSSKINNRPLELFYQRNQFDEKLTFAQEPDAGEGRRCHVNSFLSAIVHVFNVNALPFVLFSHPKSNKDAK